ncbi:hypothetical protein BCR34DRAFT_570288 [Clohesyomyces aquaticus]|uniref:Uncharacterized protein n=1 Tax=Clohesyomyces aquaticus TaxID=1231657 RepID=A0A1Y1ZCH2_9PLEO|nr:hypothetical protein BCR34DRAFT_570288 [Clohesyomyces aquaticus]
MDVHEQERNRKVEDAISAIADEPSQIDEIAKIRGWFKPDSDNDFYPAIQKYLSGTADLAETVKKISIAIDAAKDIEDVTWGLGYSVLHSAKRISFRDEQGHAKLVEFMREIKRHPKAENNNIYNFGWAARETWNDSPGVSSGYSVPEIHAWSNVNYFVARLTKEGISEFWIYAIWAMRSGLEENEVKNYAHVPAPPSRKLDAYVSAAAMWVFAMGRELYDKEKDLTPTSPNQGNPGVGGDRWKGKAEFSKERWSLWKQRFGEVAEMQDVSDETRKIANEAFEAMNCCEKS